VSVTRLSDAISATSRPRPSVLGDPRVPVLGCLAGEGIGPEVMAVALRVLAALDTAGLARVELRWGGAVGRSAEALHGSALTEEVASFCADVFAAGGAVLAGPAGGRFVYDLRRRFDLFCKLSPIRPSAALRGAARLKAEALAGVDVLIVRENTAGVYQGRWSESVSADGGRLAEHAFSYTEAEVRRILEVAARLAASRRGQLTVVMKESGVPAVSRLWAECARDIAQAAGIAIALLDVDHAAYRLIQHAAEIDVMVAPNLLGDVLCDLGAVLLGSRGLSFSGNFAATGTAVYQTNHGAAYDIAGTGRANPAGQVLSLATLLRESFGLEAAAALVEAALEEVWRAGFRTADLPERGTRVVGTAEMGDRIVDALALLVSASARRAEPALTR
jgi:3-isopropylmalate dehydrogenase